MKPKPIIPPVWVFVRWLGHWRRYEKWERWDTSRNNPLCSIWTPFKGKPDPWTAIKDHISSRTGIDADAIEDYMLGCIDGKPGGDTHVQSTLQEWWESGQGTNVIYSFQRDYPELAKRADFLPEVTEADAKAAVSRMATVTPGFFSVPDLAERHGIDDAGIQALRKRLERWRRPDNMNDWQEREVAGRNSEKYLYRESAVLDRIRGT